MLLILFRGCFWYFCRFWELQPSFQAWLRIGAEFCEFSATSSSRDEEMLRGIEEKRLNWMQEAMQGSQDFLYALRKFRNHSENFTIPTKFLYAQFFTMIAKIRYHSESYCA